MASNISSKPSRVDDKLVHNCRAAGRLDPKARAGTYSHSQLYGQHTRAEGRGKIVCLRPVAFACV